MVDSGATALFIDTGYVLKHGIWTSKLKRPMSIYNIDGSHNSAGRIDRFVRVALTVDGYEHEADLLVTDLGGENMILGLSWLRRINPEIDWVKGRLAVRRSKVTVEEVPDHEGAAIGGTTTSESIVEAAFGDAPSHDNTTASPVADPGYGGTAADEEEEEEIVRIRANRATRRKWLRQGVMEEKEDEVWCAAGFTYSQRIAEKVNKAKAEKTFEEMVPKEYRGFAKVFSEQEAHRLPAHKPWDHAIDLIPGAPDLIRTKVYPMSLSEQEELNRFLDENLAKGYIQPSKSPMASPVFFIKKKDGKLHFVQDYRKLNEITIKNRYPLPLVTDIIGRLQNSRFFTKFDVRWGYNNVRIKAGDEWKAAFATNRGLFEPKVMFFGLTNSPATFQALMDRIFSDLITKGQVTVYLDDILIFSKDLSEHRTVVKEVLRRLEANDLYLRPEKCEFEKEEMDYLGLIVGRGRVRMDPGKVKAVEEWSVPKNLREV